MTKIIATVLLMASFNSFAGNPLGLTCDEINKIDPVALNKIIKSEKAFAKRFAKRIIKEADDLMWMSMNTYNLLKTSADLSILERDTDILKGYTDCIQERIESLN